MSENEEEKQNETEVGVGGNSLVKKVGSHKYKLPVVSGDGGRFIETIK